MLPNEIQKITETSVNRIYIVFIALTFLSKFAQICVGDRPL